MPELRLTKKALNFCLTRQLARCFTGTVRFRALACGLAPVSKVYFVEGRVDRQNIRATLGRADLMAPELASL